MSGIGLPNTKQDQNPPDPNLLKRFEVVALGCHEKARREIQRVLLSCEEPCDTFLIVEYFCLSPLEITDQTEWNKAELYFPFIRRLIEDNQFIWIPESDKGFSLHPRVASIVEKLEETTFVVQGNLAPIGRQVFLKCLENEERWISTTYNSTQWKLYKEQHLDTYDPLKDGKYHALWVEFGLGAQPWTLISTESLLLCVPLATPAAFYGYMIVILPKVPAQIESRLLETLFQLTEDTYLPVLIVLHETIYEETVAKYFEDDTKGRFAKGIESTDASVSAEVINLGLNWVSSVQQLLKDAPYGKCACDDTKHNSCTHAGRHFVPMERALHKLWIRRRQMFGHAQKLAASLANPDSRNEFKGLLFRLYDTLLFKKYSVASPGLMKQLMRAMTASLRKPASQSSSLPAALVFGGPGSGKDTIARMIPLFSEDYLYDEENQYCVDTFVVNMSALRPSTLMGPLFQGLSIPVLAPDRRSISLDGLLLQAEKTTSMPPYTDHKSRAAFILDELNSMDIDQQGVLLRIIENREVMPMGSLHRHRVEHLIVGVVNEDPEEITRESEIRDLLQQKGHLGGLISGILSEMMRRTRRLRDDLFHRLKRNLYLKIPDLKDRREDIPILFQNFLCQGERWEAATVTLRAYRLLMDPRIPWPGNIRQLQGVVQRVRSKITNARNASTGPIRIDLDDLESVLVEDFPILRQEKFQAEKP